MNINPYIFRAYDIRGIADTELTEESIYLIGKAAGTYLQKKYHAKTMVVGCDNRLHSEKLKAAYIKGLIETGIDVTDVGLAVSPMIYWAVCALKEPLKNDVMQGNEELLTEPYSLVRRVGSDEVDGAGHVFQRFLGFDSGTNITASHNPKEYNGIKIVSKNAHSICGDELQEILKIIQEKKFTTVGAPGKFQTQNIWPKYRDDLCSRVKISRKLKIVIDAGNGTAGKFAPELLRKAGCEVTELFCELNGNFPNHEANPEELKNMKDLISKVLETKADLGIGFDGDGDRIGVVDEKGNLYSSDYMLLLLARDLAKRMQNVPIVFDIKISQIIIDDMKARGLIPIMSKTGHSFIETKMKELKAPLGGEVSGHLFFAENYYGFDDAFLGALKIIEILSAETDPLSKSFSDLPKTYTTPEFKAHCPDNKKFAIIQKMVAHFTKLYDCITIDGVRIKFDAKSWGAVRASNTSPNLTLRFEADTLKKLQTIQKIMADEIRKYPEVNWKNN